jgi:predicted alpha/beta superfamily hydrolase
MTKYRSLPPKITALFLIYVFFANESMCQTNSLPAINQKQEYQLKSKINKTSYQLFVSLPKYYSSTDTVKYPVLYLLDGNYTFPIAHSTRQLLDFSSSLEDIIIVGIGYTWDKSYEPWFVERWNNFTPSSDIKSDTSGSFLKMLNLKTGSLTSGGSEEFINVLKNEIIPFVEKKYKTNGDKGIEGHSLGGLFATYCLLQEPQLFNRYGINSPSLWWDNEKIFEIEKAFAEKSKYLNAQVFISVGSREGESMVPKITAFADTLKAHQYNGLTLTSQVFEDEGHFSVIPACISRTLRLLYKIKKK